MQERMSSAERRGDGDEKGAEKKVKTDLTAAMPSNGDSIPESNRDPGINQQKVPAWMRKCQERAFVEAEDPFFLERLLRDVERACELAFGRRLGAGLDGVPFRRESRQQPGQRYCDVQQLAH